MVYVAWDVYAVREGSGVNDVMKMSVGQWPKREERLRNGYREGIG